ncbi:MAG: hypothetical protein AB1Z23_07790 [Eubacteriales bacterium]
MVAGRRISVIDIGSNSVRLLVADVNSSGINEIYKDLSTTRLYRNISDDYMLDNESMDTTVKAIATYVDIANEKSSDEIYMFATAAVRVAGNKDEFIKKVKQKTRIILEVIPEDMEAEMAFAGVGEEGICGVIDIGGASTEIAIGAGGKLIEASSAKIGAVKCKEKIGRDDNEEEILSFINSILVSDSTNTISYAKEKKKIKWYGVGGTITTMAAMKCEMEAYNSDIINETSFSYNELENMILKLQSMDIEQRMEVAGLQKKRADIIVYGLFILKAVMDNCDIEEIQASDRDNLHGYIKLLTKET